MVDTSALHGSHGVDCVVAGGIVSPGGAGGENPGLSQSSAIAAVPGAEKSGSVAKCLSERGLAGGPTARLQV